MSSTPSTPSGRTDAALSAEALMAKYDLPAGADHDAVSRVLARLGDVPLASSGSRGGGSSSGRGRTPGSARRSNPGSSSKTPRSTTRVSWSASGKRRDDRTPDALSLLRQYDDSLGAFVDAPDDATDDAERRARKVLETAEAVRVDSAVKLARRQRRAEEARRDPLSIGNVGGGRFGVFGPRGPAANKEFDPNAMTPRRRERLLMKETESAKDRAARFEVALQKRDREVGDLTKRVNALAKFETENAELKIKLAALARERSALSVMNGAAVAAVEAAECVEKKKSSASTTGGLLSLTSRWHQWESEVRKGDKRLGIILKHYKRVEYELERANERAESAKTGALFAKHELQATREAMDELGKNYAAAEELLNDELRRRESLEKKLREQTKAIEEVAAFKEKVSSHADEVTRLKHTKAELLQRNLKRDHRIESLAKKLREVTKQRDDEMSGRAKLEEENVKLEERCRMLRKRNAHLERGTRVEDKERDAVIEELQEDRARLTSEIAIKEEECHMLAAMVSKGAGGGTRSGGGGGGGGGGGEVFSARSMSTSAADADQVYAELLAAASRR
ncbi:uncharacterized protein MICPUCDRAFT_58910 [Micromonas pusilla CCMP1545]|uniref:Predicted protein n=1 Tax=Micromonas pusilla (strain CCMP1545) TaxID=564608 RepID=C1MUR8_MICPC|nr:uncharacterized protein MICPUCDRAFT_58910 [Micromonas pusilla CCMP1545]EEH56678.1 predicted protein [Micromonas pusilla CCMP1545]|eukprot:XP_003059546.1 predicted protein [Micromonas pusilla CCMP1545]